MQKWMGDVFNRSDSVRTSFVVVLVSMKKPERWNGAK